MYDFGCIRSNVGIQLDRMLERALFRLSSVVFLLLTNFRLPQARTHNRNSEGDLIRFWSKVQLIPHEHYSGNNLTDDKAVDQTDGTGPGRLRMDDSLSSYDPIFALSYL